MFRCVLALVAASSVYCVPLCFAEPSASTYLFIDDHWVEATREVRRTLHQPRKHPGNPLIRGNGAWARNPYCYGSVAFDPAAGQFQFWYMSYNLGLPLAERTPILYSTSSDGISWNHPELGLVAYRGSSRNNIVMSHYGHHDLYSPSVVRDDRDPDPQRRYKMIWWDFPKGGRGYRDDGMCVAFSPDGIRWTRYAHNPVLPARKQARSISDVMSVMYDSRAGKFVAYTKGWAEPWPLFRQIVRTESEDFIHWSTPEVVLTHAFNRSDPQSYGMSVAEYENLYLGLLASYKKPGNETIDIQLTVSHDNRTWSRVADQATFIPNGADGAWDDGMIFCAPLLARGDEVWIYYGAWDGPHNTGQRQAGIGLATLRRDRFVSFDAGQAEGMVTTRLLPAGADKLSLNAAAASGEIRVEVLDAQGAMVPGYGRDDCHPLSGDGLRQDVRWRQHTTLPPSQPIRLRFWMRGCSLYAFRRSPAGE